MIYFARHEGGLHTLWKMEVEQPHPVALPISDRDWDRFHPNLHRDGNLILYTANRAGTSVGADLQIRVFDLRDAKDTTMYAPGWPVSAAVWHPAGDLIVVAEDHDRDGRYRTVVGRYEHARRHG